jgi:hypothetical protein
VSNENLSELTRKIKNITAEMINEFVDFNMFFENELKSHINRFLLLILVEYILNLDNSKVEKLQLFNLFPQNFVDEMNLFKEQYMTSLSSYQKFRNISEIEGSLNLPELSFIIQDQGEFLHENVETIKQLSQDLNSIKGVTNKEKEIMKELEQAIKESLNTLQATPLKVENKTKLINQIGTRPEKGLIEAPKQQEYLVLSQTNSFLDSIGNTTPISSQVINKFTVDKVNFINIRKNNRDFFDLANLFYYVSISKMLNTEDNITSNEILELLRRFVFKKEFSPDSKSIFFGLAILSEYDLLHKVDFIDPLEIETFLKNELRNFIPEKLNLNFYSLMCLKLLKKKEGFNLDKDFLLKSIIDFKLSSQREYDPALDMFYKLGTIKLLDKNTDLMRFKTSYFNEISKLIKPDGSILDTVTDSARGLLVISLLDLKEEAVDICNGLLHFIFANSKYFASVNLKNEFNWQTDDISFKIELRTLYWALLACSQYKNSV